MSADTRRLAPPPAYSDLPEIPAPYEVPETHFPEVFRSNKPPGPVGAPNLMAGAGLTAFAQAGMGIANAVSSVNSNTPNYSGGDNIGIDYSNPANQGSATQHGWPGIGVGR